MSNLHIHSPPPIEDKRMFLHCRKCRRRRLHVVKFYEWYEPLAKCLTCHPKMKLVKA